MADNSSRLSEIFGNLNNISSLLNKNVLNDAKKAEITTLLEGLNQNIQSAMEDIPSDELENDKVPVPSSNTGFLFGKCETCLLIGPFDCYKVFTLFNNFRDRKPFDLSDGQKIYLTFKQYNRELVIEEYLDTTTYVDKANGQVLFKITKKQANDLISNFTSRRFYITRKYQYYDYAADSTTYSDEELLYEGRWGIDGEEKLTQYTALIQDLTDKLASKDAIIAGLEQESSALLNQLTQYAEDYNQLKSAHDQLESDYDNLCNKIEEIAPGFIDAATGETNVGQLIDSKSLLIDYSNSQKETMEYYDGLVEDLKNQLENSQMT